VLATRLANASDKDLGQTYMDIEDEEEIFEAYKAKVVFARDTRASGPRLVDALKAGLAAVQVEGEDFKFMTTPQLHYIVRCRNTMGTPYEYGVPTEEGYYEKLADAYKTIMAGRKTEGRVVVDCANGVGGPKLRELIKYLPDKEHGGLEIKVVNDDVVKPEALNYQACLD
jgi:phosphoacetylglucosamine mutase